MRTRPDYERTCRIVGNAIRRWDPFGLIGSGAPDDEFLPEVERVVARLNHGATHEHIVQALIEVFSHQFSEQFPREQVLAAATEIHVNMEQASP